MKRLTPEAEMALLEKLAKTRGTLTDEELFRQTVESIWANQLEDMDSPNRLSKSEIEQIVREGMINA